MNKTKYFGVICAVAMSLVAAEASAAFVSYTVSGSSGNWTLDFSVTNDLGINNLDIYFFGVDTTDVITGIPTVNWSLYGPYIYNDTWLNYGASIPDMIQNGETLSGFTVLNTGVSAPTSVNWFAYHYDWTGGGASHGGSSNPVFYGTASTAGAVPEPASIAMWGLGALGMMFAVRKRRQSKLTA